MSRRRATHLLPTLLAVLALTLTACGSDEDSAGAGSAATGSTSQSQGADATTDSSTDSTAETSTEAIELSVDGSPSSAKCLVPSAEALATQTTAFEGTVTGLEAGTATLGVTRWFTGGESEEVTVAAPDEDLRALLLAVEFEVGKTYLVSAQDGGQVTLCGFTAEKSPELEAIYTEAFAS